MAPTKVPIMTAPAAGKGCPRKAACSAIQAPWENPASTTRPWAGRRAAMAARSCQTRSRGGSQQKLSSVAGWDDCAAATV